MKYFIIFTGVLAIVYLIGFFNIHSKWQWMDKKYTQAIKGLSILTVIWAHVGGKLEVEGIQFIAGIGVSLFLICSGFGIELSYEKSGKKDFWKKRLLGVCVPFWIVELIGLSITGNISISKYVADFLFIKPATVYGWFMGYIVICYLIYYITMNLFKEKKEQLIVLFSVFLIWFIMESLFFANPDMPSLRARQMFSFPCGVAIATNKEKIEKRFTQLNSLCLFAILEITGLLFMGITQTEIIRGFEVITQNTVALFTCLPMAIGIVIIGKKFRRLLENPMLSVIGMISYELYLIHVFTLDIINVSMISICIFSITTLGIAFITHLGVMKIKNGGI